MIKTAIILAGGLGTRLRSAVADLPKCMAPVNGKPFLNFVITYLQKEGIEKFIFSLGYKSEDIVNYVDTHYKNMQKEYVIESKQLGTGGAVKEACKLATEPNVIVVNGDTLFNININKLAIFHETHQADCTLALKEMKDFDRYGAVEIKQDNGITAFKEKQFCEQGAINGGVYSLSVKSILNENYPEVFSFEKEYLEKNVGIKNLYGIINNGYFIDIGIPTDYQQFQDDYKAISLKKTYETNADLTLTFINELTT